MHHIIDNNNNNNKNNSNNNNKTSKDSEKWKERILNEIFLQKNFCEQC